MLSQTEAHVAQNAVSSSREVENIAAAVAEYVVTCTSYLPFNVSQCDDRRHVTKRDVEPLPYVVMAYHSQLTKRSGPTCNNHADTLHQFGKSVAISRCRSLSGSFDDVLGCMSGHGCLTAHDRHKYRLLVYATKFSASEKFHASRWRQKIIVCHRDGIQ